MPLVVALVGGAVRALLSIVQICFLVRALLSWLPLREDHPIGTFTAMVTEPFIAPIRALFDRFGWFRDFPLDMPFFVAMLLVGLLDTLLFL
ncbi:MAG: YggT family protein [Clostridia bacterium]|nr:YggT family protein [Clostridia bacterium]